MSEPLQIYQTIKRTGGSGRGMSYWTVPALCGRKRRLMTEHPAVETITDSTALDTGIYYHFLKECFYNGKVADNTAISMEPIQDLEWGEAVRLFDFHRSNFPVDYFGSIVAVELKMPVTPNHAETIRDWLGDIEATGAIDLVVNMSAADVRRVEEDRGIELNGPGIYIVDHKTAGARKDDMGGKANYTSSMQCLTYMHMLSLAFNEPIQGMIFDVLLKHKVLRREPEGRNGSSIQTFFARPQAEDPHIVKAALVHADRQLRENLANPFACYDRGRECVFLSRGLCGRF